MNLKYILFGAVILPNFLFADKSNIDCIPLEGENSIVCKYTQERVNYAKVVKFKWIDPNGVLSRERDMEIPAFYGSVYDYRYLSGRLKGQWKFQVIDRNNIYETTFIID
ncbi:MAG: hypothetical protein U9Q30_01395 [Campylobacterota bacterium]|nr:hypothetical protein [Campylobacterota bacterium]